MPELPEVETVRRGLLRVLPQTQVEDVDIRLARCFVGDPTWIKGRRFLDIDRRGKALLLMMDEGLAALVHLRMTGQLVFLPPDKGPREGGGHPNDALIHRLPNKHTRVILHLKGGGRLFFNDQRTFGSIKLLDQHDLKREPFLAKLGPEPWARTFSIARLHQTFQRRARTSVKALLLDQEVVAGIGNIYADESLFLSQIHPATPAGQIRKKQIKPLIQHIREVLERGIAFGGVSARDYVNAEGLRGRMQEQLYVYKREGLPCKICETPIQKIRTAGRGTHLCPQCQPSPHEDV